MTIALWCVLVAALLPFPFTLAAKSSKRFDNAAPREYLEQSSGWRKRAHWAQLNSFEAFPPFAAAVIIAHVVAGANATADALAVAFIVLRVLYGLCYIADKATLRSLLWAGGIACMIGLFIVAARAS
ncbi:MAPEG family protein [Solimonas soli]|uniref:MAPEG family protein n=1 Tax=Solimonas soli TaxID=413479 RepID=UPI0004835791|nr:MAPEG family protein [Solimonas soli]